jgi:hypothetical protein
MEKRIRIPLRSEGYRERGYKRVKNKLKARKKQGGLIPDAVMIINCISN